MKKIVFLLILSLILQGCGDKKVDSSSDESFRTSVESVKRELSDDQRKKFEEAVQAMAFSEIGNIFQAAADPEGVQRRINDKLNGKTASQIIAEGEAVIEQRRASVRDKTKNEEEIAAKNESLLNCINSHVVFRNPRFEGTDGQWFKVDVTNNLSWAIRGYHVTYLIKGDNRSSPIKEDDIFMEISGGIEPGETKSIDVWADADISSYKTTSIKTSIINLFDSEKRRLVDNRTIYNEMSPELSPNKCR